MSLRHFAWTKSKMPHRQGNILTFLTDILPEKGQDVTQTSERVSQNLARKMSPRHLNMSL